MTILELSLLDRLVIPVLKVLAETFEKYSKTSLNKSDDLAAGLCLSLIAILEDPETIEKLKDEKEATT